MLKEWLVLVSIIAVFTVTNVFAGPVATCPLPADGRTGVPPEQTLTWTPGDFVGDYVEGKTADGHHVFLHTKKTYVDGAAVSYPLGTNFGHYRTQTASWQPTDPYPFGCDAPLDANTKYYWRVIEVNSVHPDSPWKSEVWSLTTIGPKAANPYPEDEGIGAPLNVILTWRPGTDVAYSPDGGHEIYFGTNLAAVTDANTSNPLGVYEGRYDANYYPVGPLDMLTTYYWRIDEANDASSTVKGDVWSFTAAGLTASDPGPADDSLVGELYESSVDVTLGWKAGAYAADVDGHDVFFGTNRSRVSTATGTGSNPFGIYRGRQTGTTYNLEDLPLDTTYYWRIDEVNEAHPNESWKGQVWFFSTDSGTAKNPSPGNGDEKVSAIADLSWTAGYGATLHDIYFGTADPPPFIKSQSGTTYDPGRLERDTTYYWKINEQTAAGTKTGQIWSFATAPGPVITVDQSITYQTIDGFGAHGAMNVWWSSGPFYDQQFLDLVIDDLGLTINRNEYYPKPDEPGQWPKQVPFLQAMKAKADASGEPLKFIAAYWTPPHWMKQPQTCCGGYLKPEYYDDFGDYSVQAIQDYNNIGIDLYALSLQNEPNFPEPYNSCVYNREQYRDMLKIAGPIIHAAWPDILLYGCEHMLWTQEWDGVSYEQAIIDDTAAFQQMGIWAVHGYGNDGQTPDPGSAEAGAWTYGKNRFWPTGKHFWMTETSGYHDTWADSRQLAQSIYAALKYGHASAWVWWQLSESGLSEYVLMNLGTPSKRYYISKHYYRYIRPEAVMVEGISDDPNILAVAFKHNTQSTATLVLINTSGLAKTIHLDIDGDILPAKYTQYRTTSSENCVTVGTVEHNGSFVMPASSVVTLYGTDLCPACDLDGDNDINFIDFATLGKQWRDVPDSPSADIAPAGGDGIVDIEDLEAIADCWLQ